MRSIINSIPIFSRSKHNQLSEGQKTNFWLEKLFDQRQKKTEEDKRTSSQILKNEKTSEEKGLAEAVRGHAGKAEVDRKAVNDMISRSNRILLKITSVFPLDLFPTTIVLEETRLTIIHRQLFSSQVHSVDVRNISNVFINTGILFAQLIIVSNTFTENQIAINRLWKNEAILMRRIIEGLRLFVSRDINTTQYEVEDLVKKLKELSTTGIVL